MPLLVVPASASRLQSALMEQRPLRITGPGGPPGGVRWYDVASTLEPPSRQLENLGKSLRCTAGPNRGCASGCDGSGLCGLELLQVTSEHDVQRTSGASQQRLRVTDASSREGVDRPERVA